VSHVIVALLIDCPINSVFLSVMLLHMFPHVNHFELQVAELDATYFVFPHVKFATVTCFLD
jgi:hypothetical protein